MIKLLIAFLLAFQMGFSCTGQESGPTTAELLQLISSSNKDTAHVNRLIEVAMTFVLRKDALKADMDSAGIFANGAYKLTRAIEYVAGEGKYWYVLSNIYREKSDMAKGKVYAGRAVTILSGTKENTALGDAYIELANYHDIYSGGLEQRMILLEKAAGAYDRDGNKVKRGKALKMLGEFYYMAGDYKTAMNELVKALQAFTKAGYRELQGVYDIMMAASTQIGDYENAVKYGLLALKTAENVNDTSAQLCAIYNHLGITYLHLDQYNKAAACFSKALPIAEQTTDTFDIITIGKNLANSYAYQQKPDEAIALLKRLEKKYAPLSFRSDVMLSNIYATIYIRTMNYNAAKPYVRKLLAICNSLDTLDPVQLQTYNPIISYYMATRQYEKAIQLCKYDISFSTKYHFVNRLKTSYLTLAAADSALGDYQSAFQHYKMYGIIKDSIFNESKSWQISQLQVKYETEKKDKNIQVLTREALIQKNKLQQASMQRNFTFGGTSLLLAIIGLLYSRYRTKQRTNRKLEMQQQEINEKNASLQHLLTEKEWLLKEIHHRIKNNLQTVMSLLSSQSAYLDNDAAVAAIQDSRHRIHAMSLIHQKLYTSENVSVIDMPLYIQELAGYMRDCFDTGQRIQFGIDITPLKLDVTQAIPLALILNEAITNSLKYAFPDGRTGIINIQLQHLAGHEYILTIKDNGTGMPPGANEKTGSLGMSLMKGLSEDLDGTFAIASDKGTTVTITFVHDVTIKRTGITALHDINS